MPYKPTTYKPITKEAERGEILNYLHAWCCAHNLKVPGTLEDHIRAILADLRAAERLLATKAVTDALKRLKEVAEKELVLREYGSLSDEEKERLSMGAQAPSQFHCPICEDRDGRQDR